MYEDAKGFSYIGVLNADVLTCITFTIASSDMTPEHDIMSSKKMLTVWIMCHNDAKRIFFFLFILRHFFLHY